MKKLKLKNLPEVLTEDIVKELMEMERKQIKEWKEIYLSWDYYKREAYYDFKKKIQERSKKEQILTQEEWDSQFLGFMHFHAYRERHTTLRTEDIIDIGLGINLYSEDMIEKHLGWNEKKYVLARRATITSDEKFTYFWATKSPFSQWHQSKFMGMTSLSRDEDTRKRILLDLFPLEEQEFSSAEQFMMFHKALTFLDRETALRIMQTNDVRKIKELGRQVKNFDEGVWESERGDIVYVGNKAKFTQNEELKNTLLETMGTTLVEASPNDKIWGIGLTEDDPRALKRETWLGKNLLGEILTKIRFELLGEY